VGPRWRCPEHWDAEDEEDYQAGLALEMEEK
jgi:hypothetical protein